MKAFKRIKKEKEKKAKDLAKRKKKKERKATIRDAKANELEQMMKE